MSKPSRPLKIGAPEMNSKLKITNPNGEDRLSSLPDELIHQILSFLGTRQAVQTSILSKRWKRMWTGLPVLSFDGYDQLFPYTHSGIIRFIDHVLKNRDQDTHVSCFKFLAVYPFPPNFVRRLINYTIDHNVEELDIDLQFHRYKPFKLSTFNSDTLKKLKLRVPLDYDESLRTDSEWVLPALKALHLIRPPHMSSYNLSEYCLIWLPNLTTLCLDGIRLPESLSSISVPCLTTLIMKRAKLPENVWDLPALLSLELDEVDLPANMNDFFSALVSVRDITISFSGSCKHNWIISCPQLVHLQICTNFSCICWIHEIAVLSNKLRELSLVGIFMVRSKVHELENVSVKLWDTNEFNDATLDEKGLHYDFVIPMLSELGNARTLTLDSAMIEALYTVSNSLGRVPSPFKNLKYVKLPQGNKESGISTTLRKYLLGGNPRATIVTSLPQVLYTVSNHLGRVPSPFKNLKYVKLPQGNKESGISTTLRKYLLGGNPRATIVTSLPQRKLNHQVVSNSSTSQKVCVDTGKRVQGEHLVENSVVDAGKVRQIGCPVEGTGKGLYVSKLSFLNLIPWQHIFPFHGAQNYPWQVGVHFGRSS
ncbi:putative F-box/FBD/LRR-repeat protein At3g56780 isoform X2 [Daucus carota subsp. sativus]|uniref:putative F-box/FBD/LRR-repeat protein At3g56780 isoform X2 n=1 Tax=Daucus carota subsp. sativus TaxID=79200 RepID=UPI0030833741